jgi:hypothetical protein
MRSFCSVIFILLTIIPAELSAVSLPACSVSADESNVPAEEVLANHQEGLDELGRSVSLTRLDEHRRNSKIRLTRAERRAAKDYDTLIVKIEFWEQVKDLKGSLLSMCGADPAPDVTTEADIIAKRVIDTLYSLSQEWRIGSSALFNNFLIEIGAKEKGYCYHYVTHLKNALTPLDLKHFDVRWGTAWEKTFRENNALVITVKGDSFEKGLAIDAWRMAGRPFWTKVKGDRFPWVEEFNVEERYEVE